MADGFKDHFSGKAREYRAARPSYPEELIAWVASMAAHRNLAWDAGCGNGQATVGLAAHFARVLGSDASRAQIEQAEPRTKVEYRIADEGDSGLEPASVGLVTVAQALHWFDTARFFAEVDRVLAPNGLLAVWCYGPIVIAGAEQPAFAQFHRERIAAHWPPERALVESGYAPIRFPYPTVTAPAFAMRQSMSRAEFLAYVDTWSALARARQAGLRDPLLDLEALLEPTWPDDGEARRSVSWPLALRACRKPN